MLKKSAKTLINHDNSVTKAMHLLHGSIADTRYCASAA